LRASQVSRSDQHNEQDLDLRRIADQLGIHPEALRVWVKQAETDAGERAGTTSSDAERIAALERENRELRRANQILKSAASFFAAELDRPSR
jgi:transposase